MHTAKRNQQIVTHAATMHSNTGPPPNACSPSTAHWFYNLACTPPSQNFKLNSLVMSQHHTIKKKKKKKKKHGVVLCGRWVRGCAVLIGCRIGLSGLPMQKGPFLFENWFRYRSHFCEMLNSWCIFRWFTYRLSKRTYASQFTW